LKALDSSARVSRTQDGWRNPRGFAEYNLFKPRAGIVQLPEINDHWDGDDIPDPTVVGLW